MSNEHNHFPVVSEGHIGGGSVQTVNARDLHAFLGLSRDFNQWMREQIERVRLAEGRDFQSYEDVGLGPRARREYALTLDAAKHIAMMSGTDKGFDVREYFIECERRAKDALDPIKVLNDPEAMRGLLLSYTEKVLALEAKIEAATPKVEFYDAYLNADGLYGLQNAARALNCRPNLFIRWLKENYLFYQGGNLVARIQQIQMGNFEVKTTLVDDKVRPQAFVTPKGLKYLDARVPDHIRVSGRGGVMRTVHVDELGRDKDGNEYGHVAADHAVKEGLCVNEPVRLRYPDGYTTVTNEVRITEKGLAKLASDMAAGEGVMDQHRATSDERHREIARSMGFDDQQMKFVEMYLALSHEDRADLRRYLEARCQIDRDAQAA